MAIESAPTLSDLVVLEDASTADLVKGVLEEARELVRVEVELAREEVKDELTRFKFAAVAFGIAALVAVIVMSVIAMAIVLALGATALVALAVAGVFFVIAAVASGIGYALLPKAPLEQTRNRLELDMNQLKEHVA